MLKTATEKRGGGAWLVSLKDAVMVDRIASIEKGAMAARFMDPARAAPQVTVTPG